MASNFLSANVTTAKRDQKSGQQFLHFKLLPDTDLLLPVQQMVEVLNIPVLEIVPIPDLPAWVLGVHNWRGEILWLVDLGQLIGLAPIYQQGTGRYTAIVISQGAKEQGDRTLGLLVHRVEDIEWCNPDLIESPPQSAVSTALAPFLRGYLVQPTGEIMVVLDGNSIFEAMPNK
jgi:positive phototaxis protein PixI